MSKDGMNYEALVQEALRGVVRLALERAASDEGIPAPHHFFVGFMTGAEGVEMPEDLRTEHPEQMTVVFKEPYFDLVVGPESFSVTMSFSGNLAQLTVPYTAVVTFVDPSVQFGLQFPAPEVAPQIEEAKETSNPNVVSLDAFRKK